MSDGLSSVVVFTVLTIGKNLGYKVFFKIQEIT